MHEDSTFTQASIVMSQGGAASLGNVTETSVCENLCSLTEDCVAYTHVTEGSDLDLPPLTCYVFTHVSTIIYTRAMSSAKTCLNMFYCCHTKRRIHSVLKELQHYFMDFFLGHFLDNFLTPASKNVERSTLSVV